MNKTQTLSSIVAAILIASALISVGFSAPTFVSAQTTSDVTIKTSADKHGGKFFGNGILQVIITDESKDSDDHDDEDVTIEADSNTGDDSTTITIPDTNDGSQRFEFFLVNVANDCAADLEDANTTLAVDGCVGDPETVDANVDTDEQVVTFGDGGELDTNGDLFEDTTFTIRVGDEEVQVNFQDTKATLDLDRSTYGTGNIMRITINDQDANIDPTTADTLTFNTTQLATLFSLTGATFETDLDFEEQGDNSAEFEAEVVIGDDITLTTDSATMTLNDQVDYSDPGSADNLDQTTSTSEQSFDVDDVDGTIDTTSPVTFGSELHITVTDNDRNVDTEDDDVIDDSLTVETEDGSDSVTVDLRETGDDTGVFQPDTTNNEIKITFVDSEDDIVDGDQILQLTRSSMDDDLLVQYTDPFNDNSEEETFEESVSVSRTPATVMLPDTSGINDDFLLTLTAPNLNDNSRTKDSYTFSLDVDSANNVVSGGKLTEAALVKGNTTIGTLAFLEFEVQGDAQGFDDTNCADECDIDFTLTETGLNTGIFTVSMDMRDILESADLESQIDDGDKVKVTVHDLFGTNSKENSAELSIGSANADIDFSRTVLPIPPLDVNQDGGFDDGDDDTVSIGNTVVTQMTVTDPDRNIQSNTEDPLFPSSTFDPVDDDGDGFVWIQDLLDDDGDFGTDEGPGFAIEISGDNGVNSVTIDTEDGYTDTDITDDGAKLSDILPTLPSLSETGKATGVFDDDFEFVNDGSLSEKQWQDLKVTVHYFDNDGDEQSSGITFRGNDGIVTADQDQVKNGDTVTVTVQDEDLNLDDTEIEEFESSTSTDSPYLLSVETEDDEVAGVSTETFRETGENTGVFTAEFDVGTDIPVTEAEDDDSEVTQATNILMTYNDVVDSTGGNGDELEVNVPVVSSTGAITVSPELVGPGTELHVTIVDQDLNKDPDGVDSYDGDDTGDGIVSFRTDNDDVDNDEASPDLDETGPSTGVFEFTIQLVPGTNGQDSDFADARGGSEPEVGAIPGDILSIKYDDESNGDGRSVTVSKAVEVKSFDPTFAADKDTYAAGDKVTVTIVDPDANQDPDVADSLNDIRVFSDSDAVGNDYSALETGKDTGVFKLVFLTTGGSQDGSITVKNGDDVTVEYTDDFPADYATRVDDINNPDKDFDFNIHIGSSSTLGSAVPTTPEPQDIQGKTLNEVKAGQQVVLSTTVLNKIDEAQPYVAIVEVRDSNGITVFLGWTTGTMNANGQATVGLSWTAEQAGDYQLRTFVISSLSNPNILSEPVTSMLHVS